MPEEPELFSHTSMVQLPVPGSIKALSGMLTCELIPLKVNAELLKSGMADTLFIDGIGSQSGFPSRSSFYATFKAETGMTPSQYLENLS